MSPAGVDKAVLSHNNLSNGTAAYIMEAFALYDRSGPDVSMAGNGVTGVPVIIAERIMKIGAINDNNLHYLFFSYNYAYA